jgi:hypothetical protein
VRGEGGEVPPTTETRKSRSKYKTRPATPENFSAEQRRANEHDPWLLTEQPLDEETKRTLARKDEAEKKE